MVKRQQVQKKQKQADHLRQTMEGHVRHEKEKFERLARQMEHQGKDLALKSDKLRQVAESIKNSPLVSVRSALKESATPNVKSDGKVCQCL